MKDTFLKRAIQRKKLGYFLLSIGILIIISSIFIAIIIASKFSNELSDTVLDKNLSKYQKDNILDKIQFKYSYFLAIFISTLFFISQILLRLYNYTILKADFFLSCSDSLSLSEELNDKQKAKFESILSVIISEKIILSTPDPPKIEK